MVNRRWLKEKINFFGNLVQGENMKAIVLAYHNIGCTGIKALLRNGFEIAAVFTHNDDPEENIWFDSVAELAASQDIPVYAPEDINHPIWVQRIRELNPDISFLFIIAIWSRRPSLRFRRRDASTSTARFFPHIEADAPLTGCS